jgi:hypothetical protein
LWAALFFCGKSPIKLGRLTKNNVRVAGTKCPPFFHPIAAEKAERGWFPDTKSFMGHNERKRTKSERNRPNMYRGFRKVNENHHFTGVNSAAFDATRRLKKFHRLYTIETQMRSQ